MSGHPLARYADRLRDLRTTEISAIDESKGGSDIAVAGIVVSIRAMRSRKGARWAIFTLQDMGGLIETLAFPESFARMEPVLKTGAMLFVRGRVTVEDAGIRVVASDAKPIEDVAEAPPSLIRVRMNMAAVHGELLDQLKEMLSAQPGGCNVVFDLQSPDGTVVTLESKQHVRADRALISNVRELCGSDSVEIVRGTAAGGR